MEKLNANNLDQVSGGIQPGMPGQGTYEIEMFCNTCNKNVTCTGHVGTRAMCPNCHEYNLSEKKLLK